MFVFQTGSTKINLDNANEVARFVHDFTGFDQKFVLETIRKDSESWTFCGENVEAVVTRAR